MAELHVVGQILGGTGFPSQNIFCKVRQRFILCTSDAFVAMLARQCALKGTHFPQLRSLPSPCLRSGEWCPGGAGSC